MILLVGGEVPKVGESDVQWSFFLVYFAKIKKEKLPLHGKVLVKWQTIHFF
jgi:hypothetical protein